MSQLHHATAATLHADAYQDIILPKVSRTFALTIPQLPPSLRRAVANAYLLCRIADTIEDEPTLSAESKRHHEHAFLQAVTGEGDPQRFAAELFPLLSKQTLEAERELVQQLPLVLQVTDSLKPTQRASIIHCLQIMSRGMYDFQREAGLHGLSTLRDMDRYCYCVAGVVGEMLTELFIDFEPAMAPHRKTLMGLALSFGQGLQMTNILKDQWEDRQHDICWLPQEVFSKYGINLTELKAGVQNANYAKALTELIGVAHSHLRRALEYTLLIPAKHTGLRRFCLWSVGLAVLTLRKLQDNLDFSAGTQVKVSRNAVVSTIAVTNLTSKYDGSLRWIFTMAARRLPLTPLSVEWNEPMSPSDSFYNHSVSHLTDASWREVEEAEDAQLQ